jgi:class 3 adenylate cyclase/TolB-like protein/Tfp pilus assembly protein PilF
MSATDSEAAGWPGLHRVRRAVVVVDVVESVRLMREHEDDVIDRWRRFVSEVTAQVLPLHGGRMVKSLGDGMLLEFMGVRQALAAAVDLQQRVEAYNDGRAADRAMRLRASIHYADVAVESFDLLGAGVNLASRLATLARPGEVVLSTEAVDELVPGLDPPLEDLGECWLKHYDAPVRAFRLLRDAHAAHAPAGDDPPGTPPPLTASIAVIPLACLAGTALDAVIGDIVADGVIGQLSRSAELTVLSRLSTASLRGRELALDALRASTGARYVLSGSYAAGDGQVLISVELADSRTQSVLWGDRLQCTVAGLLAQPSEALDRIAQGAHAAILEREAKQAATQALPSLESFSLLYGGVGLLHRASAPDFARARAALVALCERVPRHGASHAWLAKWHCLRLARGQAGFAGHDGSEARWRIEQALERDPDSALAWALHGLVLSWVDKALDRADDAYREALARNPNEPLAWLYTCTLRSWQGRGAEAADAARRALSLSPLDPMRYYFETLGAAGFLAAGEFDQAIALCQDSLRLNRAHTPTHRVLAIAQVLGGQPEQARQTVRLMLALQPGYTAARYLDTYPGGRAAHALTYAEALRSAGLPA